MDVFSIRNGFSYLGYAYSKSMTTELAVKAVKMHVLTSKRQQELFFTVILVLNTQVNCLKIISSKNICFILTAEKEILMIMLA